MKLNFGVWKLFGQGRTTKKFGSKQDKINGTSFTKCHLGQNRRMNIGGILLNMARKDFDIFEQDMTQKNY